MKHKTIFRLILKALGVWLFVIGASGILGQIAWLIVGRRGVSSSIWPWENIVGFLPQLLETSAGLYLFFDGRWVVDKAIPSNRPYCHECGYDLTGAVGDVCNECGTPFRGPTNSTRSTSSL
jgi:hypothetical protein